MKALLKGVGTSFCPDHLDWLGNETGDNHSRNADRSVVAKFLQSRPADYSTTKLQVKLCSQMNCLCSKILLAVWDFAFLFDDTHSSVKPGNDSLNERKTLSSCI